jgi:hypothetical protein
LRKLKPAKVEEERKRMKGETFPRQAAWLDSLSDKFKLDLYLVWGQQ